MEQHILAYYTGIFILFASHLYLLMKQDQPMLMYTSQHIWGNLLAGCLIAYYFMWKENMIQY